ENLNAELRKIRSTGYSLVMGELEEGLVAIGAPVFNHNAEPVAAISLVGPSVRINREKAVALSADVMSTAASISYAIGYREPETV
ncbi:MAG: IclR family transcriptional regulator C-terminal domain-containing protein, partial [Chloroflexota bacterium]